MIDMKRPSNDEQCSNKKGDPGPKKVGKGVVNEADADGAAGLLNDAQCRWHEAQASWRALRMIIATGPWRCNGPSHAG